MVAAYEQADLEAMDAQAEADTLGDEAARAEADATEATEVADTARAEADKAQELANDNPGVGDLALVAGGVGVALFQRRADGLDGFQQGLLHARGVLPVFFHGTVVFGTGAQRDDAVGEIVGQLHQQFYLALVKGIDFRCIDGEHSHHLVAIAQWQCGA